MKILVCSPFYAPHWDSGHFWVKALSELGHDLCLWDYRTQKDIPIYSPDIVLVLKGDLNTARRVKEEFYAVPVVCYFPDTFERFPKEEIDEYFSLYNEIFTPLVPTPKGTIFLPTGWDEDIHVSKGVEKYPVSVFIGTCTPRKEEYLKVILPTVIGGNGWERSEIPGRKIGEVYLHNYVTILSQSLVSVNVHRDPTGVNRRLFESMACTFTLTDIVPGVSNVLGPGTWELGFSSPEEGRNKVNHFLSHPKETEELFKLGRELIAPYTYKNAVKEMLRCVF